MQCFTWRCIRKKISQQIRKSSIKKQIGLRYPAIFPSFGVNQRSWQVCRFRQSGRVLADTPGPRRRRPLQSFGRELRRYQCIRAGRADRGRRSNDVNGHIRVDAFCGHALGQRIQRSLGGGIDVIAANLLVVGIGASGAVRGAPLCLFLFRPPRPSRLAVYWWVRRYCRPAPARRRTRCHGGGRSAPRTGCHASSCRRSACRSRFPR